MENRAWFQRTPIDDLSIGPVVRGWGVNGAFRDQDRVVLGRLQVFGVQPLTLGATKDGHLRHPLYPPGGAGLKNKPHVLRHSDHEGKRRFAKGFTDKALTEQLAAKLENEALSRKWGMINPA